MLVTTASQENKRNVVVDYEVEQNSSLSKNSLLKSNQYVVKINISPT